MSCVYILSLTNNVVKGAHLPREREREREKISLSFCLSLARSLSKPPLDPHVCTSQTMASAHAPHIPPQTLQTLPGNRARTPVLDIVSWTLFPGHCFLIQLSLSLYLSLSLSFLPSHSLSLLPRPVSHARPELPSTRTTLSFSLSLSHSLTHSLRDHFAQSLSTLVSKSYTKEFAFDLACP